MEEKASALYLPKFSSLCSWFFSLGFAGFLLFLLPLCSKASYSHPSRLGPLAPDCFPPSMLHGTPTYMQQNTHTYKINTF